MPRRTPQDIHDYAGAAEYLAAGKRNKTDRPHGHARRIIKGLVEPDTISVVYHKTPIVTWYPDGSTVIWFNAWMTSTTMNHILSYADIRPRTETVRDAEGNYAGYRTLKDWSFTLDITGRERNGRGDGISIVVGSDPSWPRTPAKVQKCRQCSGTGTRVRGWGKGSACDCDGGRRDYGSKLIPITSDGTQPILISPTEWAPPTVTTWNALVGGPVTTYACTCKLCQSGSSNWMDYYWNVTYPEKQMANASIQGYKPGHVPVTTSSDYSDSGEQLKSLLPGLNSYVPCPACKSTERRPVRDRIIHLNDSHKWTREQIADWLESLDVDLSFPITTNPGD